MAGKWRFDATSIDLTGALTLVFVRQVGKKLHGWRVEVDTKVEKELREQCGATLKKIKDTKATDFSADLGSGFVKGEQHVAVPEVKLTLPGKSDHDGPVETEPQIRRLLGQASSLPTASAEELSKPFRLYAVMIGDDPEDRAAFVRKSNPHKFAKPGTILTSFAHRLKKVEGPLFVLEDYFHIVVAQGGLVALDLLVFEQLFRDTELMLDRIPKYITTIEAVLLFDGDGAAVLAGLCGKNAHLQKKLRAIHENGHLSDGKITISDVRAYAKAQDLPVDKLFKGSKLVVHEDMVGDLLKLLNEDLFRGALSKKHYEASSKGARD